MRVTGKISQLQQEKNMNTRGKKEEEKMPELDLSGAIEAAKGGVDLASPLQNSMRSFQAEMTNGRAAIQIGVTVDGRMVLTTYTPGGMVEMLGLAMSGALAAWHQQQHQGAP